LTARNLGLRIDLIPDDFVAEGVVRALCSQPGGMAALANCRILIPRAREARDLLPRELAAAGARVDIVPCYESIPGKPSPGQIQSIRQSKPDLLIFTSSSILSNFVTILGRETGVSMLRGCTVAVLGPVIAQTAESYGKKAEIVPKQNTVASLVDSIYDYFRVANRRE
jgi:uroporphyrinogen III methyltransferase/synthase